MFETSRRQHPLHTFRFWFFILAAAFITLAWKFDMLPVRIGPAETGQLASETFTEVEPLAKEAAPNAEIAGDALLAEIVPERPHQTAAIEPAFDMPAQSEPEPTEPAIIADRSADVRQTASTDLFDDDWATDAAAADVSRNEFNSYTQTPNSEPAVVPASATTTSFESQTAADTPSTADLFEESDVRQPAPTGAAGIDFSEIDRLLGSGLAADEIEAHRLLSTIYWKQPESRLALRERIDSLAQQIYFLGSRHYMDAYQVQPGDMLQKVAAQYDVTWQYLSKLNRVDPKKVRAGQRLKVIKGPFSAIVDLSDYELTIHAHGYYVTRFPVGIGKDGSSPIGKFTVLEKLIDPTYYGPDGVVAHDDPTNPLGERWIDIGNSYGLHGTTDPTSIGKSESKGCIRLHNDDIAAVYDLLTIGSEVVIRP